MKTDNVKVGDRYYGIIYRYSFKFLKGIKIKEFEVVKVNPKSFKIAFDAETRRWPQLMKKEDTDVIDSDPIRLAKKYMDFVNQESKFPDHLKESITRYCKRKIREFSKKK